MSGKIANARKGGSEVTRYVYLHFGNKGITLAAVDSSANPVWISGDTTPSSPARVMVIPPDVKSTDYPPQLVPDEVDPKSVGVSLAWPQGYSRYWVSSDEKNCVYVYLRHVFLNGVFVFTSGAYVEAVSVFEDDNGKEFLYCVFSTLLPPLGGRSHSIYAEVRSTYDGAVIRSCWNFSAQEQLAGRVSASLAPSTKTTERVVVMSPDGKLATWVIPHTYTLPSRIYSCDCTGAVSKTFGPTPQVPADRTPPRSSPPSDPPAAPPTTVEPRASSWKNEGGSWVVTKIDQVEFTGWARSRAPYSLDTSQVTEYAVVKSPVRPYYDKLGVLRFITETLRVKYNHVGLSELEDWSYGVYYHMGASDPITLTSTSKHYNKIVNTTEVTVDSEFELWDGKVLSSRTVDTSGSYYMVESNTHIEELMDGYLWFAAHLGQPQHPPVPISGNHSADYEAWSRRNGGVLEESGQYMLFLDAPTETVVLARVTRTNTKEYLHQSYSFSFSWPFPQYYTLPPQTVTPVGVATTSYSLEVHIGNSITIINLPANLQGLWAGSNVGSKTCLLGDPLLAETTQSSKGVLANINCVKYGRALIVSYPRGDPADTTALTTLVFSLDAQGVTLRMTPNQAIISSVKNVRLI